MTRFLFALLLAPQCYDVTKLPDAERYNAPQSVADTFVEQVNEFSMKVNRCYELKNARAKTLNPLYEQRRNITRAADITGIVGGAAGAILALVGGAFATTSLVGTFGPVIGPDALRDASAQRAILGLGIFSAAVGFVASLIVGLTPIITRTILQVKDAMLPSKEIKDAEDDYGKLDAFVLLQKEQLMSLMPKIRDGVELAPDETGRVRDQLNGLIGQTDLRCPAGG